MEFKNIEAPECSGEFLSPFRCLRLSVADSNGLSPAWFFRVENGADQLIRDDIGGDIHNDNPCEEINQFTSAGKFYGYPYCFSEGILDNGFGKGKMTQWAWPATFPEASFTDEDCRNEELVKRPAYCLPAHWAPLGFAFQPPSGDDVEFPFPSDGEGDMIVFSHGSWNRNPPSGYAVARVKFDISTGMPTGDDYELIHDFLETRSVRPVDGIFLKDGTLLYTSDSSNELIAIRHSPTDGDQPPAPVPQEICFPGSSTVELEDGSFKSMDLLDIGDRVRSSETEFSTVFLFTRRMQKDSSLYMIVGFESGESLSVASSHYLLDHSDKLILAEEVAVGDVLYTEKVITSIRRERRMGVYHPHTLNDVLYVDGIRVSCFTSTVPLGLARILLWPLKVAFRLGYTFKGLEGGPPLWATRLLKMVKW
uniref:Hint domain-containing protein n=2 Tax=Rhodosorus marinus TaxID=101924 RepID=A0A7S3E6P9_9RHOD|mmetsp:Transcript_13344/g.53273  ORF Transcript_13344/g.53273 Transcript_13344/m.53273 type:complete len:422 (+) Transcript_13344:1038-2303(+)